MADANIIGGALPFGSGGGAMDFSGNPAGLAAGYAGAYDSALQMNKQNYANILQGYQQTAGTQNAAQNQIQGGYGQLTGDVLGGIQGVGASQAQAIKDYYAQQSGAAAQDLVNRGLGNTTVANSVQRGLSLDQNKANVALANQMAQLYAGYQSNLGMAGLNFANQANMQNTALAGQQLNWMNSVNAPYPNAQQYTQLAQMYGQGQAANADRALAAQQLNRLSGAGAVPGAGTSGYTPGGGRGGPSAGLFTPSSYAPGLGAGGPGGSFVGTPGNGLGAGAAVAVGGTGEDYGYYDEAGTGAAPGDVSPGYLAPWDPAAQWGGGAGSYAANTPPTGQFYGYGSSVPTNYTEE